MSDRYKKSGGKEDGLHHCTRHFTHIDDAVPRLPPLPFYKHVGRGFLLHADGEVVEGQAAPLIDGFVAISEDIKAALRGRKPSAEERFRNDRGWLIEFAEWLGSKWNVSRPTSLPVSPPLTSPPFDIVAWVLYVVTHIGAIAITLTLYQSEHMSIMLRHSGRGLAIIVRKFYRDTLLARDIEITDTGAVHQWENAGQSRRIRYGTGPKQDPFV